MLTVDGLEVMYGRSVVAVRDATFSIAPGRTTTLLGANGAGKTTLLRAITGMLGTEGGRIVGGDITLDERSIVAERSETIARLGMAHVPQGRRVFARMTVEENLLVGGHQRSRRDANSDLLELFEQLAPIARRRRHMAGLLSGGEQQLLAIGRALMSRPAVLLLDEPTLGLAPMTAREVLATVGELVQHRNLTALLVEQNARLALRHADRALVLERGSIVRDLDTGESDTRHDLSDLYLGSSLHSMETTR